MCSHSPKQPARATSVLLLALLLFLSGCAPRSEPALTRIRREGAIRIGYAVEAPYIYVDQAGALTGLEYAIAVSVVESLGVPRIDWVQTEFGSLIGGLVAGEFDLIAAGMFITPERAQRVAFSEPTFHVLQALLVRIGNPLQLHSYADLLLRPEARVAVLSESIEQELIRRSGVPASRLLAVPDALTGRVAVESGLADCLALSAPTVRLMAQQQHLGHTEIADPFRQPAPAEAGLSGYGAAAFRLEDADLREAWNAQLARYVGSPEHLAILERFGFGADASPGAVTSALILQGGAP